MMKYIIAAVLFIGLVGLSGCLDLPIFSDKAPKEEAAFVGGTVGLQGTFLQLPQRIFQNTELNIILRVENKGEATVPQGAAQFTLNNAGAFQISQAIQTNVDGALERVKKFGASVQSSDPIDFNWTSPGPQGLILTEEQAIPFSVDLCYPYSTFAVAKGCAARTNESGVCEPDAFKTVQNSGSPIQVTSLRNVAVPRADGTLELALIMEIENRGNGDVFNTTTACSNLESGYLDKADVKAISFGGRERPFTCTPSTSLSFINDEAKTTCRITVNAAADVEDDLLIELAYYYRERVSSSISVIPL